MANANSDFFDETATSYCSFPIAALANANANIRLKWPCQATLKNSTIIFVHFRRGRMRCRLRCRSTLGLTYRAATPKPLIDLASQRTCKIQYRMFSAGNNTHRSTHPGNDYQCIAIRHSTQTSCAKSPDGRIQIDRMQLHFSNESLAPSYVWPPFIF